MLHNSKVAQVKDDAESRWTAATIPDFNAPDMSLLEVTRHQAPPFPTQVLQPAWQEWVEMTAAGASAPKDYVAGALITVAASLIGNARWLHVWGNWSTPPVLWWAMVGPPSTGKTPALSPLLRMLRQIERDMLPDFDAKLRGHLAEVETAKIKRSQWEASAAEAVKSGRAAQPIPEDAMTPLAPERPRIVVTDFNEASLCRVMEAQPKGLLAHRDELSGWCLAMDKDGHGSREFYLECYNGGGYTVDRVKFDGKPRTIERLSLCVVGGLQPAKLSSAILAGEDDGLSARFIYSWPDVVPFRRPKALADDGMAGAALRRLAALQMSADDTGTQCPMYLTLAPEAQDILEEYSTKNRTEVMAESGMFAGFIGKMPGVAARLALTLQYLWWSTSAANTAEPNAVTATAIKAALALVDGYVIPMGRRSFMDAALPLEVRNGKALARYIHKNGVRMVNGRELYRKGSVSGITTADTFRAAAEYLVDAGWLVKQEDRGSGNLGRSRSDYITNPAVLGGVRQ